MRSVFYLPLPLQQIHACREHDGRPWRRGRDISPVMYAASLVWALGLPQIQAEGDMNE